jgi:hypothetical protein
MAISLHEDKRVPFDITERRRAEDALRLHAERQAMLLEVTSDLIRACEPGELGRKTFEHVRSAFGAVVCTNYRLDPATHRLRLVFVHGIPPEHLEGARSLELGQEYCGTVAASCQPLMADKLRIASDPNGGLVRELGATAYACYPLKASDGRLLGRPSASLTVEIPGRTLHTACPNSRTAPSCATTLPSRIRRCYTSAHMAARCGSPT